MARFACVALVLAAFVAACRGGPAIRHERGAGNEPAVGPSPATPPPRTIAGDYDRPGQSAERGGEVVEVVQLGQEETEEPELDLGIRVRNAYGYPAECLGPGAVREGVTEFSIRVSVTMTATGTVTRSSVYGPVSAEALACLERRAAGLRVAGPIPDAPRTVSTSIEMHVSPAAAAAEARVEAEEPEYRPPPGAQPAAQALPAVVGDGPAPGAQPPGVVLPAVVGDGPAPGSVAADRALPARGASSDRGWMWISGSAEARGEVPDRLEDED